jgi:hypothetical protein
MKRHIALLALLALPALATLPAVALAANNASTPSSAEAPPPPTITEDQTAAPEPEVRIIQDSQGKTEEYRMNGRLYMVKVTPVVGPAYYLMDQDGTGKMKRIDPTRAVVIPQWVLLKF